jgi:hypothetical protein
MLSASLRNQINPQPSKAQHLNKRFIEPGRSPLAWSLTSWFTYVSPLSKSKGVLLLLALVLLFYWVLLFTDY